MTRLIGLCAAFALLVWPILAVAQGTQVRVGTGLSDPEAPVEITSDELRVDRESGMATFTGNVLVVQSQLRLTADQIEVLYDDSPAEGAEPIRQVIATGNVVLINGDEAAEGDKAVLTPADDRVVVTGNVLLTQGPAALSGGRLVVDLATGAGVMEGRVRTVFTPGGN